MLLSFMRALRQLFLLGIMTAVLQAADPTITGKLLDPRGAPVNNATIRLGTREVRTNADGAFLINNARAGSYEITASAPGFEDTRRAITMAYAPLVIDLRFERLSAHTEVLTVTADVTGGGIQQPDPAQRVFVREEILDANPGRPGAPISIPGLPIETASSGIKAPQYFAPGVAGDHGEPIAQFIQVGSYLLPNNLSANAHGNGYADPNIMVPAIIESVETDGGAFNVREGDHSVDLAVTYALRPSVEPFAALTADYRDVDLSTGWKWLAAQASYGNGFLDALEHRQQYKINALKGWTLGAHQLTMLFIGYYGQSKIPGLVPLGIPDLHDTIDSRQHDQTHTGEEALNDVWHLTPNSELQFSGFFRTYSLSLVSDFGAGLIRQSEFRTEAGGNATYLRKINTHFAFMAGLDYLREAPRRDNLDRFSSDTTFTKITANDITLNFVTPFIAIDGAILPGLRYNLGWRRDQISFDNADLLNSANSFSHWVGINSPKATLSLIAPEALPLPSVSLSFGQTFFTSDPRIGVGVQQGSLVSQAHAYQMVVSKKILKTDLRITLAHVTQEASFAKIDPDTGLQFNEGPSRNQYITVSARRYFRDGFLQASVSKADARDLENGLLVPEAPRLILDVLGTYDRLPFQLHARAEFEQVGRKPLGDGFVSVPVNEFRGALVRDFERGKMQAGIHFQLARGYSGQTTEVLALPSQGEPFEQVVGVYLPSYATASFSYHFGRR